MTKKKYTIVYMGDPNLPADWNHRGSLRNCTQEYTTVFSDSEDTLTFWFECSRPLTELCDIELPKEEQDDINIEKMIEEQEKQYLIDLYFKD